MLRLRRIGPTLTPTALTVSDIRSASPAFAAVTSVTDGFHPRHFRLSDEALESLCRILNCSEALDDIPSAQGSIIIIAMLSKPAVGFRPIGLVPRPCPCMDEGTSEDRSKLAERSRGPSRICRFSWHERLLTRFGGSLFEPKPAWHPMAAL